MNKFELNKTMECFGFNEEDVYEINGLKYYHDNRYFTIVKGKTPLELAKLIMKKYDNNIYRIRVNGLNENQEPAYDVFTYHIDTIEGLIAFIIETKNYSGKEIELAGWVRTARDSKTFGFIELNDGSFFKNVQIVFNDKLENFKKQINFITKFMDYFKNK